MPSPEVDRAALPRQRFREAVARRVRDLAEPELIAEHRRQPIGQHSDRLERLLTYLRTLPTSARGVIIRLRDGTYALGAIPPGRGRSPMLTDDRRFATLGEAEHELFLARLREVDGEPEKSRTTSVPGSSPFLTGYADPFSVRPGQGIDFMLHAERVESFETSIVRLDRGPGGSATPLDGLPVKVSEGRQQATFPGSCIRIDDPRGVLDLKKAFLFQAFVFPTLPDGGPQAVMGRWQQTPPAGALLLIDDGHPAVWLALDGACRAFRLGIRLRSEAWYDLAASWEPNRGLLRLHCQPVVGRANGRLGPLADAAEPDTREWQVLGPLRVFTDSDRPFLIAAAWSGAAENPRTFHFNGKIEAPCVWGPGAHAGTGTVTSGGDARRWTVLARWDFSAGVDQNGFQTSAILDSSGNDLHGVAWNSPARGMTGHQWNGREHDFRVAPGQYGAIHFHEDDLADAAWQPTTSLTVPVTLASGVYALRVEAGGARDDVPFVVRPPSGQPRARVAVLLPTATYLAYSNQVPAFEVAGLEAASFRAPVLAPLDVRLYEHPEFGFSSYDRHRDGSGISYVSRRRPILNLRPDYLNQDSLWALPADLCLLDWLREKAHAHDVITDEDLHAEGADLLRTYQVVLTGTHPEYASEQMLNGLEEYVATGGRLMYLGGNGFYWVVSFDQEQPWVMEVRKQGGSLSWRARPGEHRHSTTGELGGLWRNRGRPPQKLVGVGFGAQGFDRCSYFRRLPDSEASPGAWIFEGVNADGPVGNYGLAGDGAAGLELDRYDLSLGTPPGALLLASSEEHTDAYQHAVEEVDVMRSGLSGTYDPDVRADLVYFITSGGGAVFSTGSIAWCTSLGHNGYRNDISQITDNVLRRFLRGEPLPPA